VLREAANFHDLYRPFIQVVATHTFADRVSVSLSPTFAFNTRNDETFVRRSCFTDSSIKTHSLWGLEWAFASCRLRPSSVNTFRACTVFAERRKDYAGLSVGIEKSTFRHTFQLVVGRQEAMTTAQYAVQGRILSESGSIFTAGFDSLEDIFEPRSLALLRD